MGPYQEITSNKALQEKTKEGVFNPSNAEHAENEINLVLESYFGEDATDWTKVKGLDILDIGCGSNYLWRPPWFLSDIIEPISYPPLFCRILAANGANVFGIDIRAGSESDKGLYTHIVADVIDVVEHGKLEQIPGIGGKTFDIVHSFRFVGTNPDPGVSDRKTREELILLEQELVRQSESLLNEGGILCLERTVFQKRDNVLLPIAKGNVD